MKYYMVVNRQKIFFPFNLEGFRMAQLYLLEHGLKSRKLHIVKDREENKCQEKRNGEAREKEQEDPPLEKAKGNYILQKKNLKK